MIFLFFVLDIVFYNYTHLKTNFVLLSLLEKEEPKSSLFLSFWAVDFLLGLNGKFFLLFFLLYLISSLFKGSLYSINYLFLHFVLLYSFYKILVLILFHTFSLDSIGLVLNLLFIYVMHKKEKGAIQCNGEEYGTIIDGNAKSH